MSATPSLITLTLNGTDYSDMIDGPISAKQSDLDLTGLVFHNLSLRLTRRNTSDPSLSPDLNNDLCDGRIAVINIRKRNGSTVPFPCFHTMYVYQVDHYRRINDNPEYAIIDFKCRLGYFSSRRAPDNRVRFDPLTGISYSQAVSTLLRSQGIVEGLTEAGTISDLIFYPLQDYEDRGGITQAGALIYSAPGGNRYLYADNNGNIRYFLYSSVVASQKFEIPVSELIGFQQVNNKGYGRANPVLRVDGVAGSAENCSGDGTTITELRQTRNDLFPTFFFGDITPVVMEEITTTITTTATTRTIVVTRRAQQITVFKNPFGGITGVTFGGLQNKTRVTTTDTYNSSDSVITRIIAEEVTNTINGIIQPTFVEKKRINWSYAYNEADKMTQRTQRIFERFLVRNGRATYTPIALFSSFGQLVNIGGLTETWTPQGCKYHFNQSVSQGQSGINNISVTAAIDSDGFLNSEVVDEPPPAPKKPRKYETKSTQIDVVAYADVGNCPPAHLRVSRETVDFVYSEAQLAITAVHEMNLLWGRAWAQKILVPILDTWIDAVNNNAANNPIFRVDTVTPDGGFALVWTGISVDIELLSGMIEIDAPALGRVSTAGGAITRIWNTRSSTAKFSSVDKGDNVKITGQGFNATIQEGVTENVRANVAIASNYYWEIWAPSAALKIGAMLASDSLTTELGVGGNGWAFAGTYDEFDVLGLAYNTSTQVLTFYKNGALAQTTGSVTGPLFPAVGGDGTGTANGRLSIMDRLIGPIPNGFTPYG